MSVHVLPPHRTFLSRNCCTSFLFTFPWSTCQSWSYQTLIPRKWACGTFAGQKIRGTVTLPPTPPHHAKIRSKSTFYRLSCPCQCASVPSQCVWVEPLVLASLASATAYLSPNSPRLKFNFTRPPPPWRRRRRWVRVRMREQRCWRRIFWRFLARGAGGRVQNGRGDSGPPPTAHWHCRGKAVGGALEWLSGSLDPRTHGEGA